MVRHTPDQHEVGKDGQNVLTVQLPANLDGETLPRELINYSEHPERASITGPVLDEVISPHMIGTLRPKTDA